MQSASDVDILGSLHRQRLQLPDSISTNVKTRSGTRVPCDIPVTVISLDPLYPFSELCRIILVNANGCTVRISRPAETGTPVRLQGLSVSKAVTARVTSCISLGKHERSFLLGLMIDEPGNVWGIENVPADWKA